MKTREERQQELAMQIASRIAVVAVRDQLAEDIAKALDDAFCHRVSK
jgi:hypothetical protein